MTAPEPTPLEAMAEALLHYDTSGLCDLGKACDLCDCGMDLLSPADRDQRTRQEIDRARHAADALLAGDWLERVIERHQWTWIVPVDGWNVKCRCDEWQGSQAEHIAHQAAAIRAAAGVGL